MLRHNRLFAPRTEGDAGDLPLADEAREALLRRLEAWIEEEERLIAEIERRVAAILRRDAREPAVLETAADR